MSKSNLDATDPLDPQEADALLADFQVRAGKIATTPSAAAELDQLEREIGASLLRYPHIVLALFTVCSVTINIGDDLDDETLVKTGRERAAALVSVAPDPVLISELLQNIANAESILFGFEAKKEAGGATPDLVESDARFRSDSHVVTARRLWSEIARWKSTTPDSTRSRALCNLANTLDLAGRWVEAYSAYADALEAEPTNGNAAGNRAVLLLHRLRTSPQQAGHIAAVYEKWARRAKVLRAETVAIAGEHAAQLWDALPLSDEPVLGHLSHDGDLDDPYQSWIVGHRLALVPTVEGLGSDSSRWDTADILAATVDDDGLPPRIFAAMNVLKAEFIVARRLAFRGERMTFTEDGIQHPEDTGEYGATGDGAVYGEGPATLLLAQRSALDLLDKIAVTANEHFKTGIQPQKVDFTSFWRDTKTQLLRPTVTTVAGRRARLALAELQRDLASDALYPSARLLRNAGTHRLVHGTLGKPTGPTKETFSTIDLVNLHKSTIEALGVARAAFLYLIDLIDAETPQIDGPVGTLHSQF